MQKNKMLLALLLTLITTCFIQIEAKAQSYQYLTSGLAEYEQEKGEKRLKLETLKSKEKRKKSETSKKKKFITRKQVLKNINSDLKVNKPCGLSKKDFIKLMKDLKYEDNGFFSENAEMIWKLEKKYQVNALFVCGLKAVESGWISSPQSISTNNFTSQLTSSEKLIPYDSVKECFEATFKNLSENYLQKKKKGTDIGMYFHGYTIPDIGIEYCTDGSDWDSEVISCMKMFFD